MTLSLERLRRRAKALKKAFEAGDSHARQRVAAEVRPLPEVPKHADYLHVVAREANFESWPKLKLAAETEGLDRAGRQQRLKIAVRHGQNHVVEHLLRETPDLARGLPGIQIALYDRAAVAEWLAAAPERAVRSIRSQRPIHYLAMSRWIHARPELREDMLATAGMLVAAGADVNDGIPAEPGSPHRLSALYFALGHAGNVVLARWLLEHGADPDDGESLYHATELGHRAGLALLLKHGARPGGRTLCPGRWISTITRRWKCFCAPGRIRTRAWRRIPRASRPW